MASGDLHRPKGVWLVGLWWMAFGLFVITRNIIGLHPINPNQIPLWSSLEFALTAHDTFWGGPILIISGYALLRRQRWAFYAGLIMSGAYADILLTLSIVIAHRRSLGAYPRSAPIPDSATIYLVAGAAIFLVSMFYLVWRRRYLRQRYFMIPPAHREV